MRKSYVLALAFVGSVGLAGGLSGCIDDPMDPKTWIKKLGDPREGKEAVTQLVRLKDPSAVEPLMALYKKSKEPEVLKAIATFKDKRATPVMIDALDYNEESFDAAAAAATALGETPDPSAVDALIKAATKPLSVKSRANVAKLEAIKALRKIGDKKAVPALAKLVETSADEQDIFLNQQAAQALGDLRDPAAVPALIRGLFIARADGANIFQPCRVALLQIGAPAAKALMDAHEHKVEALEADAKKYEFREGVIEQKTSLLLGDLRAKEALPLMLAELKKPKKGDNHTGALYAIGMIGDKAATKDVIAVLTDSKRDYHVRISAAEALNFLGDLSAAPALLSMAKTGFVQKDGEKYSDVRVASAMAYARIGGPAEAAAFAPVAAAEKEAQGEFGECMKRLELAKACGKDVGCYAKALEDKELPKVEKAAFMLGRMGKEAVPALLKKLSAPEAIVRVTVIWALGQLSDKGSEEVKKALEKQIDADRGKAPLKGLVEEMRATLASISSRG